MRHSFIRFLLLADAALSQETKFSSLASRIDLPNVNGRIDRLSADLKGHRLFVPVSTVNRQPVGRANCQKLYLSAN